MDHKVGDRYRLNEHVGYDPSHNQDDAFTQFLNKHHPLFKGQVGAVVAVVPAADAGAGSYDEDHVVLEFEPRRFTGHGTGNGDPTHEAYAPGEHYSRNVSFTQAQMDSLFSREDAPQPATQPAPLSVVPEPVTEVAE